MTTAQSNLLVASYSQTPAFIVSLGTVADGASVANVTPTLPAFVPGDLLICWGIRSGVTGTIAIVASSGSNTWNLLATNTTRAGAAFKIAVAGDVSPKWGSSIVNQRISAQCMVVRGQQLGANPTVGIGGWQAGANVSTLQAAFLAINNGDMAMVLAAIASNSNVAMGPADTANGFTQDFEFHAAGVPSLFAQHFVTHVPGAGAVCNQTCASTVTDLELLGFSIRHKT